MGIEVEDTAVTEFKAFSFLKKVSVLWSACFLDGFQGQFVLKG